jgi:hypothetical protein
MRIALFLALIAPLTAQEPRVLFLENCATCHGESGDGQGTTPLAKPARSFLDGGFSYGNTPTAIGRTIEHGIPGTPMPSFAEALDAEQRAALVEYVISLGPPRKQVELADTILEVADRPLVVRGFLPALGKGLPEWPRGLLVGLTSGTTFQYRGDDLRLLAVRQGDFVQRRDWSGRGGNPLRPLGTVTHLVDGGNPAAAWREGDTPLRARLVRTAVRGQVVTVTYDLQREGRTVARVEESPSVVRSGAGAGFSRRFRISTNVARHLALTLRWGAPLEHATVHGPYPRELGGRELFEHVYTYEDPGGAQLVAVVGEHPHLGGLDTPVDARSLRLTLTPGTEATVQVLQASLIEPEALPRFLEERQR